MSAGRDGRPKPFTAFDMQNEVTWLANQLPEWREASIWCGHRTAQLLAKSIEAFYSRAKKGAGKQSGYPRYKRRRDHDSIPHRFASGCRLDKDPRHKLSWKLKLKGIPGEIHARGEFPGEVIDWTDADVMWRSGRWEVSVCVTMTPRRHPGSRSLNVNLDLIDCFALVDNVPEQPRGLLEAQILQDKLDGMKSELDQRWPRGKRVAAEEKDELYDAKAEISRLSARIARKRSNALHVWTTGIVARASDITIMAPRVKENTKTPRGDEKHWGANIEIVSDINRNTLGQAPAMAIQMLKYKAEEAGIRCDIVDNDAPNIGVGRELVTVGKTLRRARRKHTESKNDGV